MSEHNIYVEPEDETVDVSLQDEVRAQGGGGGAGVDSFNGRNGRVVPQSGDYTKAMVGLGNVDNTSDADKPVSTATQAALDLKANLSDIPANYGGTVSLSNNTLVITSATDASEEGY